MLTVSVCASANDVNPTAIMLEVIGCGNDFGAAGVCFDCGSFCLRSSASISLHDFFEKARRPKTYCMMGSVGCWHLEDWNKARPGCFGVVFEEPKVRRYDPTYEEFATSEIIKL